MQVLVLLSYFVEVPPSLGGAVSKTLAEPWVEYFQSIKFNDLPFILTVGSRKDQAIRPDILENRQFATVKYRGHWFYITEDDFPSKDILSSMVGIFTMLPTGKKETPQLTLPVR